MGEASESTTPRSTAEAPQLKAAKDKKCPFCGQDFTASSLGRHLDLYIRPKNPKPDDGIHLVDEIRKMRGGITRRQIKASVSLPRRENIGSGTPVRKQQSLASEESTTLVQSPAEVEDQHHSLQVAKMRVRTRHAGGGRASRRPSKALAAKSPDLRRDVSRQTQKAELDQRSKTNEQVEIAGATEMALRELLKSVREANAKASGSRLFDFDPYALDFPSLCLQILPAPSTLFSPTPFPTSESWSIAPPGQKQFEALNSQVRERLLAQQRQRQINQVYPSGTHSNASSVSNSPLPTPPLFDPDPQKLFGHIADAYSHWVQQGDKVKQELWQIEILRSYARADDRRRETEVQLDNARREIEYLKANRWTSGASDISPITISLGKDTTKELGKYGMHFRNWDYDRLIDKMRGIIREGKAAPPGMATQQPLPGTPSGSMANLTGLPYCHVHQPRQNSPVKVESLPYTAPSTVADEPESDQMDAEGDDDEDIIVDQHTPPENRVMMQQHPEPIHAQQQQRRIAPQPPPLQLSQQVQSRIPSQMQISQAHLQAQAQANAQAQAQAQAWHQHVAQSRNQNFSPLQHQQMSPHVQHVQSRMGSATSSRRPSVQLMDAHNMGTNAVNGIQNGMGLPPAMDGMQDHQEHMFRMEMGLSPGFVGTADGSVGMGT